MLLQIAAKTDIGQVREHNEDNFIVCPDLSLKDGANWTFDPDQKFEPLNGTVLMVADGMGGTNAGEVASRICAETIRTYFSNNGLGGFEELRAEFMVGFEVIPWALSNAIRGANYEILKHIEANPDTQGMGTTIVLSILKGTRLSTMWVGDSRLYLFRSGKLELLTKDHSKVQEWIDNGELSYEEAFYHPSNHIITQHLGAEEIEPGFNEIELESGDILLLCSDGLNGMLLDSEIEEILHENSYPKSLVSELINKANKRGGRDNITVIVLHAVNKVNLKQAENAKKNTKEPNINKPLYSSILIVVIIALLTTIIFIFQIGQKTFSGFNPSESNSQLKVDEQVTDQSNNSNKKNALEKDTVHNNTKD